MQILNYLNLKTVKMIKHIIKFKSKKFINQFKIKKNFKNQILAKKDHSKIWFKVLSNKLMLSQKTIKQIRIIDSKVYFRI